MWIVVIWMADCYRLNRLRVTDTGGIDIVASESRSDASVPVTL